MKTDHPPAAAKDHALDHAEAGKPAHADLAARRHDASTWVIKKGDEYLKAEGAGVSWSRNQREAMTFDTEANARHFSALSSVTPETAIFQVGKDGAEAHVTGPSPGSRGSVPAAQARSADPMGVSPSPNPNDAQAREARKQDGRATGHLVDDDELKHGQKPDVHPGTAGHASKR